MVFRTMIFGALILGITGSAWAMDEKANSNHLMFAAHIALLQMKTINFAVRAPSWKKDGRLNREAKSLKEEVRKLPIDQEALKELFQELDGHLDELFKQCGVDLSEKNEGTEKVAEKLEEVSLELFDFILIPEN